MMKRVAIVGLIGIGLMCGVTYRFYALRQKPCPPRVAAVIVIDQFAYHHIPKLKPFFSFGFKELFDHGVVFHNAFHPHAAPATATGHTALNTGAYARHHAVILNDWFDSKGKKVTFASDQRPEAGCLSSCQHASGQRIGYSCQHILADTLSDQVLLASSKDQTNNVFALSLKPRSAIAMAGHRGHALWFDAATGGFTSSKAFFDHLPGWVTKFNESLHFDHAHYPVWPLVYPASSKAYVLPYINNYDYAATKIRLAGKKLPFHDVIKKDSDDDRSQEEARLLMKTPLSNKMVLDCAEQCIKMNYCKDEQGTLLVWVSLSSLDMLGHLYGPDSLEVVDMLYHLDRQIGQFIENVQRTVGEKNLVVALTGDHGVARIPELAKLDGKKNARRIVSHDLIAAMNELVAKKYGLHDCVRAFKVNQFFLNKKVCASLDRKKKNQILADLQQFLVAQPGIKKVWTYDQLRCARFRPGDLELYYKNQLYEGRSGDLICMPEPYCAMSKYSTGTVHRTPYEYDTHVPLVIYQKGVLQHKVSIKPVLTFQLPVTLAKIIGVPKPEGATEPALW